MRNSDRAVCEASERYDGLLGTEEVNVKLPSTEGPGVERVLIQELRSLGVRGKCEAAGAESLRRSCL